MHGKPFRIEKLPTVDIPSPTRSRCVLVVAPNEKPQLELEITGDRIKKYAAKCDADFLVIDKLPDVGHPCAYKHVLTQVAPLYEQTLVVDTDIIVKDCAPVVFDYVPLGKWGMTDDLPNIRDCGASRWMDSEWEKTCQSLGDRRELTNTWNSGWAIAPPDACREYFAPDVEIPDVWCIEQHLLTYELLGNRDRVVTLGQEWQAGYPWRTFLQAVSAAHTIHINGCRKHSTRLALLKHFDENESAPIPQEILSEIRKADWAPWWATARPLAPKKPIVRAQSEPCECPLSGWCNRHAMFKHEAWHGLCQKNADYRRAWDNGDGPGQPRQEQPSEREVRRLKVIKRTEETRRRKQWIAFFKIDSDTGLGDTAQRLLKACDGDTSKVELRKALRSMISACACGRKEAIKRLNSEMPYKTEVTSA